jgi:hypothetical protein
VKRNIDIVLEGYRRIYKAKGYNYIFVIPIISIEGYFLFITFFNINLVIGILNINFIKYLKASELVYDL